MTGNIELGSVELGARGRMLWIGAAMLMGVASQFCINYGICAAPLG